MGEQASWGWAPPTFQLDKCGIGWGLGAQGAWKILGDSLSSGANEIVEGTASTVRRAGLWGGVNTKWASSPTIKAGEGGVTWQQVGAENPHFPSGGSSPRPPPAQRPEEA